MIKIIKKGLVSVAVAGFLVSCGGVGDTEFDDPVEDTPKSLADDATLHALRILLVEDDETVRKILTRQIEQNGMSVIAVPNSSAAEVAFHSHGPFDVVVSDIVMPGEVQGPELITRLRMRRPRLPAVLISGYPQDVAIQDHGVQTADILLMKPVSREDLVIAINAAIKQADAT